MDKYTTKSQFYQANSTGRFQFSFKQSVQLASFPILTPSTSTARCKQLWFPSCPSDQLDKQRKHDRDERNNHLEDLSIGKKTYEQANKQTNNLISLEDLMQRKTRVTTLEQKRNHIPLSKLGDKIYPYPEYEADYFKQNDGVIPGQNIRHRYRHPFKISKKYHG